jgi:hypothetical protein
MLDDAWLAAAWEAVIGELPAPPASVVEVGCGPLGGLVPLLRSAGYAATGVDPAAPPGSWYCPVEYERYDPPEPVDVIVACTSLHHVCDLGEVAAGLPRRSHPEVCWWSWSGRGTGSMKQRPGGALTGSRRPETIPAG